MKKTRTGRTLHYFLQVLKKRKLALSVNIIAPVLALFFGEILLGYTFGQLVQKLVEFEIGDSTAELYRLAWIILVLYIMHIIFFRINDYVSQWRIASGLRDLEQYIFSRLPLHSYRFFSETYGGSLVSQVNRFLKSYHEFERVVFFNYLEDFARIVLSAGILFFIAPALGVLLAVWAVIFIFSVSYLSMKKAHITRIEATADSKVVASLSDVITNMITVKTFARARLEAKNFQGISADRYKKRLRSWMVNAHIRDFRWFVTLIFFVTYIFLSIHLVINGSITPATMVASQIYVFAIIHSLLELHMVIQSTEQLFADAAELTDVLDMDPELSDPEHPEKPRIKEGRLEFNSVGFKYPDAKTNVFSSLKLEIPSGQKVGLVGHSGSGKSTLTRLILRFQDIQGGEVLIDGQNIAHITQEDLRKNIAYIPQEPILFHRSLMENIRYGRENATDKEVYEAARLSYADEFIKKSPHGYETLVGERGVKLSGGEKQRIAIARAMLTRAPILILDEATSALDSKSEKLITEALDKLMKGRTTIVIAHRLSTIRKLDRIIVLKDGDVIEDGAHKALLQQKGEYAELWSHQTGNFLDSA